MWNICQEELVLEPVTNSQKLDNVNFENDSVKIVRIAHISGLSSCQTFCIISCWFYKLLCYIKRVSNIRNMRGRSILNSVFFSLLFFLLFLFSSRLPPLFETEKFSRKYLSQKSFNQTTLKYYLWYRRLRAKRDRGGWCFKRGRGLILGCRSCRTIILVLLQLTTQFD